MKPQQAFFKGDTVRIMKEEWTEQMTLQVRTMTEWGVRKLNLHHNNRATIVKQILHIRFTALRSLQLGSNQIQSIEALPNLSIPHICEVFLHNNNITSIRVIRKVAWPFLTSLYIHENHFGDAKKLTEACFPKLIELWVYNPEKSKKNNFTEHCFPPKLQAMYLKQLKIRQNHFCFDVSIKIVLEQKWPKMNKS